MSISTNSTEVTITGAEPDITAIVFDDGTSFVMGDFDGTLASVGAGLTSSGLDVFVNTDSALSDNLNMLFPRAVDESSIDVIPAAETSLPEANVFNDRIDKFMRVMGTTAVIKFNANASELISGIAIGPHNLIDGSTIRLRVYAGDDQTGTLQYDSTALVLDIDSSLGNLLPQIFYHVFDEVAYQSIQLDISAPSNTYQDYGQILLGYVFEPAYNFSLGHQWKWIDDGNDRTAGNKYRQFSFELKYLDNNENDIYENEKMKLSKQKNLLLCLKPSATGTQLLKKTAICKRVNDIVSTRNFNNNNVHKDMFREVY